MFYFGFFEINCQRFAVCDIASSYTHTCFVIIEVRVALWKWCCFYYLHSTGAAASCLTWIYQNIKDDIVIKLMFFLEVWVLFGKFVKVVFFISFRYVRFPVSNIIQHLFYFKTWVSSNKILLCIFPLFFRSLVSPTYTICCAKCASCIFCR